MKHLKTIGKFALPALILALPLAFAFAQVNVPPEVPPGRAITLGEVIALIRRIAQLLTTIGIVIGVIFIAFGGIKYMTAAGNEDKVAEAQATVKNGLIGIGIVLGIGVLIQTVAAVVNRSIFQ